MLRWWLAGVSGLTLLGCSQAPAPVRESGPSPVVTIAPGPVAPVAVPAVTTVPVAPASIPDIYRVKAGDNLFRIALDHGLDYRQVAAWNGLSDPGRIQAGDQLRLKAPPASAPAGESPVPELPDTAPTAWSWPAKGSVIGRFGGSAGANGLDIAGERGSPVLAAADGQVVYVGAGLRGYGKLIIIKHSKSLLSAYGHNDSVAVKEGQGVKLGEVIAVMGDSDADRVKLHFEIREYGKPVDPMAYLPG